MSKIFKAGKWRKLESETRYQELPPQTVLQKLQLHSGDCLVDIGCGSGFFSRAALEIVGPLGRVIGVDLEPKMLEVVRSFYPDGQPENLELLVAGGEDLPLPDNCAELVLLVNVLHEAVDPLLFIREAARTVKTGGKLAVIEFYPDGPEQGPPRAERIAPEQLHTWFIEAGLKPQPVERLNGRQYAACALQ